MQSTAADPDRYAIVGHPVGHSWSPFIHGLFAKQTGQALTYRMIDLPPERFRVGAIEFFTTGGKGLNITVPHKQAAAELVNQLSPAAERARAVNTICMQGNELLGDNTDGAGLLRDLSQNIGFVIEGKSVLILGQGARHAESCSHCLPRIPRSSSLPIGRRLAQKNWCGTSRTSGLCAPWASTRCRIQLSTS